jgi:hypothetical protein
MKHGKGIVRGFSAMMKVCALGVTLIAVAGVALAQGGPGGRRGGFGGPGGFGGGMMLLRMPEVQTELKLDPAQKDLLGQLGQEMQGKMQAMFQESQSLSQEERMRKFGELMAANQKQVNEILDPKQQARLKQLEIQQGGLRSLGRPDVQTSLKLSQDQKNRIGEALQGEGEAMRAVFQGFQPGQQPSPEQREANMKKMQEVRSATDTKLNTILSPAQKQQFEAMQGAKFTFPPFRGFGGPGGRRGGGGGGGQ